MGLEIDDEHKWEELKKAIFSFAAGGHDDYIEEFLGYAEDISGLSSQEIEELMDETYSQMLDDVLEEFYEKYMIK